MVGNNFFSRKWKLGFMASVHARHTKVLQLNLNFLSSETAIVGGRKIGHFLFIVPFQL